MSCWIFFFSYSNTTMHCKKFKWDIVYYHFLKGKCYLFFFQMYKCALYLLLVMESPSFPWFIKVLDFHVESKMGTVYFTVGIKTSCVISCFEYFCLWNAIRYYDILVENIVLISWFLYTLLFRRENLCMIKNNFSEWCFFFRHFTCLVSIHFIVYIAILYKKNCVFS